MGRCRGAGSRAKGSSRHRLQSLSEALGAGVGVVGTLALEFEGLLDAGCWCLCFVTQATKVPVGGLPEALAPVLDTAPYACWFWGFFGY